MKIVYLYKNEKKTIYRTEKLDNRNQEKKKKNNR